MVNTQGLFPETDGIYETPYRETLLNVKVTANLSQSNYLTVRYGRNENSQPYNAAANRAPSNWGDSTNEFNSINLNENWVIGSSMLNEFIFQYADFANNITARSQDPFRRFPNGVQIGQSPNTPQTTEQKKWQFRDDFSWHLTGKGGVGHDMKAGLNFINEPRLFITFNSGKGVAQNVYLTDNPNGPIGTVTLNDGDASANIPLKQYAFYVQDDWALTRKLTLNLGLRWDLIDGYQFDQSLNPNFVLMQNAGRAGQLAGIRGLENFGQDPQNDKNNWQPRVGFAYDLRGDGKDVIRGGWGIYMDMAYTNSNALFAASDASGRGFGAVLSVDNQSGIRNPDGTFYQVGQPLSNLASQNQSNPNAIPLFGQWTDPRLQMPYTRQASFGWSHELRPSTVLTVDFVRADGRDLNVRPRINTGEVGGGATGTRRLAFLGVSPAAIGTRPAISAGESKYTALITGVKRRMLNNLDFTVTYTLAEAKSQIGTASDELNANLLQDAALLYDDPADLRPDLAHRRAAPGHAGDGVAAQGLHHRADLLLSFAASGADHHRRGHEPQPGEQRPPGARLQVHRRRPGAGGHRRLRDVELQPRRVADADEPARVARLQPGRLGPDRGDRGGLQPAQREEPELHHRQQPAERAVHAAGRLRGRFPAARAARRSDRVPLHVLRTRRSRPAGAAILTDCRARCVYDGRRQEVGGRRQEMRQEGFAAAEAPNSGRDRIRSPDHQIDR